MNLRLTRRVAIVGAVTVAAFGIGVVATQRARTASFMDAKRSPGGALPDCF